MLTFGRIIWGKDGWLGERKTYLVHLDGDYTACLDGALSRDATGSGIAADIGRVDVGDGGVGRRDTGALVIVVDAIDPKGLEGCVGGDVLYPQRREGCDGGGLHGL